MSAKIEKQVNARRRSHPCYTEEDWEALRGVLQWCMRCGSTQDLTKDHRVPLAKGGRDTLDNLTVLCKPCNENKGSKLSPHDTPKYLLPSQERALKRLPQEIRHKIAEALHVVSYY